MDHAPVDTTADGPGAGCPAPSGFTADADRADVARVLAGDREAFAALVDRHQGRVVGHLRRLVSAADADDLAQDAFVRAYEALDRYDPRYPFRGWLLVIASRLAINHGVRRREAPLADDHDGARDDDPARVVAEADAADHLARRLARALEALPPDARALYELRFRQELAPAELARHFAISGNALKVRIHRLRRTLARHLGLDLGED